MSELELLISLSHFENGADAFAEKCRPREGGLAMTEENPASRSKQVGRKAFGTLVPGLLVSCFLIFQNCAPVQFTPESAGETIAPSVVEPLSLGALEILGVTGPSLDKSLDALLVGERTPIFHWSKSVNAQEYEVFLRSSTGSFTCPATKVNALFLSMTNCALPDGVYSVTVKAIGLSKTMSSPSFSFQVDASGPSIVIDPALVSGQNTSLTFRVSDPGPLKSVKCTLSGPSGFVSIQDSLCGGLTSKSYSRLPYGVYTFTIQATDQYSNLSSASQSFSVVAPPCTPLVNFNANCDKRLKANLYFHTNVSGLPVWNSVNDYIERGTKAGTLDFSDLWIPTRSFISGFPNVSNRTEYFALDILTQLKTSTEMPAGAYQLGTLSDDGSIVSVFDAIGNETTILNQDGYTSTRLGCAQTPITLQGGAKIKLRIRYFQGPSDAMALVLLYRPIAQSGVNSPVACGTVSQDFFGTFPVPVKSSSDRNYPNTLYAKLLTQGWRPVPLESFWNPDLP